MKRVLSLVLALVMVLGTLPMAFAADETAGEMLQAAGFVAGDENGNLMEDESLTRAMLAVLVAELNGVKENAKTYAIAPEFKDVKADDWFGPYVAYAAKEGWFKGDTEGNFNPNGTVSDQTMATVMLRALGYEPSWETAVSEAKAMGLPVGAADASMMTRGEAFATMWGVVNTPKKDSDVALGVELGKIEPAQEEVEELIAEIDTANTFSLGNTLVNVDFKETVDAAAAGEVSNYTIVEKADTTKEIAVLSAFVFDGDDVFLETESLTAGKAYAVIVGDSIGYFSGIAKDSDKPSIDSVKGRDTGVVRVTFEDALVDRASAEDVANYSLSGEGTIVKAEVNSGLTYVDLTIEGMTSTKTQKLTVENVMSIDGVVMSKETKTFGPKYDKTAPKIKDVDASDHNNVEVLVVWDDAHGVDKATAEDVSNYHIDGLEIISAKATYVNDSDDDYYDKVILTTAEQAKSKKYTLEVKYMVDGSTAANATTKVLTEKFSSGSADKDEPDVDTVTAKNLTEVYVKFTEANALDISTALDASNYEFQDNELEVVDVRLEDADDNGNSYSFGVTGVEGKIARDEKDITVILTVTEMEEKESYKLKINNIADNFGNAMDKEVKKTVKITEEIKAYYQIDTVQTTDLEEIKVVFKGTVTEDSAEDATNYVINGGIGAAKKAVWSSSDEMTVTLTVPKLTQGKTYEITVNNVENFWGYAAENVKKSFIASSDDKDETQPELDNASYENKGELVVEFDEPMRGTVGTSYVQVKIGSTYYRLPLMVKRDDDKTFVFDAYNAVANDTAADFSTSPAAAAKKLTDGAEVSIESFNITDLAGNTLDYTAGDETFSTEDEGDVFKVTDKDDAVEADSLSQDNGNTIEVTFDRQIKITGDEETTKVSIPYFTKEEDAENSAKSSSNTYEFTYEITGDDKDTIVFTKTSGTFPDDTVYLRFDFNALDQVGSSTDIVVTDVLNRASYGELNVVGVDNDDEVEPVLEDIEVVDNETILLHFSEKLKTTGSYKIKYEDVDDDDKVKTISNITESWDDSDKKDVVKLKLNSNTLTNQEYDLHYVSSPRDLANNKVEDDSDVTSFTGVDTAPATDMIAAKVEGALNIQLVNDKEDFVAATTATILKGGSTLTGAVYTDTLNVDDDAKLDVVIRPYFALLNKDKSDNVITYSFTYNNGSADVAGTQKFTGGLEEDTATKVATATATGFKAIQLTTGEITADDDNYEYRLVTATTNTIAAGQKLAVVETTGMTFTDKVLSAIDTNVTVNSIALAPNGDIVIVLPGSASATDYKIIAVVKDDNGNPIDTINVITESFNY